MRRAGIAAAAAMLAAAAPAAAYYPDGAHIVSASFERLEQGDDSSSFAHVAAQGRYVAFQTRSRNLFPDDDADPPGRFRAGGVFRHDLQTGRVDLVADGDQHDEATGVLVLRGAGNPSIAAAGRYVAFSTVQKLAPEDVNDNVDVYVRDMAVPIRSDGAFELVSAKDGGDEPAQYGPPDDPKVVGNPGADVTRGAAISADGRRVVFRTTDVESDLPDEGSVSTPPFQVLLRDLDANTTRLVSRRADDPSQSGTPAGGATGPAGISGDGSTVVWTSQDAEPQTRFLTGENPQETNYYYLWRNMNAGPAAPTRRPTGIADPDDPACVSQEVTTDPTEQGPCNGPLTVPEGSAADIGSELPGISHDGRRLVFLTGAGPRPNVSTGALLDVYLTDMSPGVSRKAGTVELTREGSPSDEGASAQIDGVALSPDGRYLALASRRTTWVLPALSFTGTKRLFPDQRETLVADLETRVLERATRAFDGRDIDNSVGRTLTISNGGDKVAFTSTATNHFFGDANGRADAFVASRGSEPSGEGISDPLPAGSDEGVLEDLGAAVVLGVKARRRSDGSVLLTVQAPAAGTVSASSRARLGGAKASGRRRRARLQTLASVRRKAERAGPVRLVLRPKRRHVAELRRRRRIATSTRVTFTPIGQERPLRRTVRVTFQLARKRR